MQNMWEDVSRKEIPEGLMEIRAFWSGDVPNSFLPSLSGN